MSVRILIGDAIDRLRTLDAESVHCVVTSPPYWGLRDYGTAKWEGGDPECDHRREDAAGLASSTLEGGKGNVNHAHEAHYTDICARCGACRVDSQLGLEPTPEQHCVAMVEVFREVWRVLRNDGTLWLNYGDCYNTNGQGKNASNFGKKRDYPTYEKGHGRSRTSTLKPKDLVGMPWRIAFALQADGWYLRSDIIWHKPNTMPESVTDRPTKSHEHLFLMTKAAKYFYDADAVREPHARFWDESNGGSWSYGKGDAKRIAERGAAGTHSGAYPLPNPAGRNLRDVWTIATQPFSGVSSYGRYRIESRDCAVHGCRDDLARVLECGELQVSSGPPRSLGIRGRHGQGQEGVAYSIAEDQYGFLSDVIAAISRSTLIRKMAVELAQGDSYADKSGSCTEYTEPQSHSSTSSRYISGNNTSADADVNAKELDLSEQTVNYILGIATFLEPHKKCSCQYAGKVEKRQDHFASFPTKLVEPCIKAGTSEEGCCGECGAPWVRESKDIGEKTWKDSRTDKLKQGHPSCSCESETTPCTVLDPFGGAGTVGLVADRLGRDAILIELNPAYAAMAKKRVYDDCPLFTKVDMS